MDKTELLIIRACKSLDPETRLVSVYKRKYGNYDGKDCYIAMILENICEKFDLVKTSDLLRDLHPDNQWKFNITDSITNINYWSLVKRILTSLIRLTPIDKFDGFISPIRFKRDI